ncbi:tol-pal system protein YbgF [Candidatus Omnitrophus magneticus]|uniref:Tol-pal system protein YbgF n=1 Tax=Candidatus Omnitrophus magneticus TaxID=1609969 RepID=A0A0F0CSW2_9BACT|nr:tol-pal system protein YbgF [Candidatus Omnitrophus magneticus]
MHPPGGELPPPAATTPARPNNGGAIKAPSTTDTTTPKAQKPPTSAAPQGEDNVKSIYDEALSSMNSGDYKAARKNFISITKEHSSSKYNESARFLLAETYYKEGKYEDAILSYQEFVKLAPKSSQIPAAKLKQGLSFLEIKDKDTASSIFKQVANDYPNSKEAEIANIKLKGLTGGAKPAPKKIEDD